jgi:hypothetical protein
MMAPCNSAWFCSKRESPDGIFLTYANQPAHYNAAVAHEADVDAREQSIHVIEIKFSTRTTRGECG